MLCLEVELFQYGGCNNRPLSFFTTNKYILGPEPSTQNHTLKVPKIFCFVFPRSNYYRLYSQTVTRNKFYRKQNFIGLQIQILEI